MPRAWPTAFSHSGCLYSIRLACSLAGGWTTSFRSPTSSNPTPSPPPNFRPRIPPSVLSLSLTCPGCPAPESRSVSQEIAGRQTQFANICAQSCCLPVGVQSTREELAPAATMWELLFDLNFVIDTKRDHNGIVTMQVGSGFGLESVKTRVQDGTSTPVLDFPRKSATNILLQSAND
ncbi:hypothetical protein BJ912DRAFT_172882 [Pholiota molesta]|nr:hypothetical protein BJ912DRAFT_172882 [Pholiota molesta]